MTILRMIVVLVSVAAVSFSQTASAGVISFGSGGNAFNMTFVEIGSPGNVDDT